VKQDLQEALAEPAQQVEQELMEALAEQEHKEFKELKDQPDLLVERVVQVQLEIPEVPVEQERLEQLGRQGRLQDQIHKSSIMIMELLQARMYIMQKLPVMSA
jgi:hypothetical protein